MVNVFIMVGMVFVNVFLGVCYFMVYKLGVFYYVLYGVVNVFLIIEVMKFNFLDVLKKMGVFF